MRYECTLRAYDTFDKISLIALVREGNGSPEFPYEERVLLATHLHGTGEDDPVRWLRAVLLGVLDLT